jgi:hypothetical protein
MPWVGMEVEGRHVDRMLGSLIEVRCCKVAGDWDCGLGTPTSSTHKPRDPRGVSTTGHGAAALAPRNPSTPSQASELAGLKGEPKCRS